MLKTFSLRICPDCIDFSVYVSLLSAVRLHSVSVSSLLTLAVDSARSPSRHVSGHLKHARQPSVGGWLLRRSGGGQSGGSWASAGPEGQRQGRKQTTRQAGRFSVFQLNPERLKTKVNLLWKRPVSTTG